MTTHNHDVLMAINSRIINGRTGGAAQLNADYRALVRARDEILKLREKLVAAQRQWVGLTEEDLKLLSAEWRIVYGAWMDDFAKDIEAKLKEKNT